MVAEPDPDRPGFLSRWSQRKTAVRRGQPLAEPAPPPGVVPAAVPPGPMDSRATPAPPATPAPEPVPPTLADVQAWTPAEDFTPFMARGVTPEVKNAAMKKLFTDPHYNLMDGLDTYIDDYAKSDPIPQAMLRQMNSAQFLRLFEDDEAKPTAVAVPPGVQGMAPADTGADPVIPPHSTDDQPATPALGDTREHHDHTDLRLQPDHAAATRGPGESTQ